jgi:hypothetical protein
MENADDIQGKILNWMFVLSLSMVTDVYKVYRKISCILQVKISFHKSD